MKYVSFSKTTPSLAVLLLLPSLLLPLLLFLLSACSSKPETAEIKIGNTLFTLEVARTPEEREKGLMHRKTLPEDGGMIFVFPGDSKLSFWMKNTSLPLSIAFVSGEGVIKEIYDLEPFSLKPVQSVHYVRYAIELNRGAFVRAGAAPGDKILLPESF